MEEAFAVCIALGRHYDFEEEHSRQDARLAVRLFDLTAALHGLDDEYRDLLYCAALLHDIGKASVTKLDGERITAYGHDRVGAEMTQHILQRLQLPAHRIAKIVWLVRHHSFHLSWNLSAPKQASKRQQLFAADQRFPLLLELLRVDCVASVGNPRRLKAYELYQELRQIVMEKSSPSNQPPP